MRKWRRWRGDLVILTSMDISSERELGLLVSGIRRTGTTEIPPTLQGLGREDPDQTRPTNTHHARVLQETHQVQGVC